MREVAELMPHLDVDLDFAGEPFNREAVIHTIRHLAMREGWRLHVRPCEFWNGQSNSCRILYSTTENPDQLEARPTDVVILSSDRVRMHFEQGRDILPILIGEEETLLPFPHPKAKVGAAGWISADVVAGAFAVTNLIYEERSRKQVKDGWITWRDDWMARSGLEEPAPLADSWLGEISKAANRVGWRATTRSNNLLGARFVIILTHDVDYLPGRKDRGIPRFARALMRQLVLRKSPSDAIALWSLFFRNFSSDRYRTFESIMNSEEERKALSSFQVVVAGHHKFDPGYDVASETLRGICQKITNSDWELCLHGSYSAARTPGQLRAELELLEDLMAHPILGHRQHYLNFHPSLLFDEVERAGLKYDLSVGYNDRSGPRAGTFFPYRPFNLDRSHAYDFWEIPFVLMDTTLATTYRFSATEAFSHARMLLEQAAEAKGCVGIIWHQEQLGGQLDPGYDRVYYDLLDWINSQGGLMTNGKDVVPALDGQWNSTLAND